VLGKGAEFAIACQRMSEKGIWLTKDFGYAQSSHRSYRSKTWMVRRLQKVPDFSESAKADFALVAAVLTALRRDITAITSRVGIAHHFAKLIAIELCGQCPPYNLWLIDVKTAVINPDLVSNHPNPIGGCYK
jgi:hypothetical protein